MKVRGLKFLAEVFGLIFFPFNIITFNDCIMLPAQPSSVLELLKSYLSEYIEHIAFGVPDVGEASSPYNRQQQSTGVGKSRFEVVTQIKNTMIDTKTNCFSYNCKLTSARPCIVSVVIHL